MSKFKVWHSAAKKPSMRFGGAKIDRIKLVLVRVLSDGFARFEMWEYTPKIDGPWDNFVKEHQVKIWAIAGYLLRAAREEAEV